MTTAKYVSGRCGDMEEAALSARRWYEDQLLRAAAREDALRRALRKAQHRFMAAWAVAFTLAAWHVARWLNG